MAEGSVVASLHSVSTNPRHEVFGRAPPCTVLDRLSFAVSLRTRKPFVS